MSNFNRFATPVIRPKLGETVELRNVSGAIVHLPKGASRMVVKSNCATGNAIIGYAVGHDSPRRLLSGVNVFRPGARQVSGNLFVSACVYGPRRKNFAQIPFCDLLVSRTRLGQVPGGHISWNANTWAVLAVGIFMDGNNQPTLRMYAPYNSAGVPISAQAYANAEAAITAITSIDSLNFIAQEEANQSEKATIIGYLVSRSLTSGSTDNNTPFPAVTLNQVGATINGGCVFIPATHPLCHIARVAGTSDLDTSSALGAGNAQTATRFMMSPINLLTGEVATQVQVVGQNLAFIGVVSDVIIQNGSQNNIESAGYATLPNKHIIIHVD